MHYYNSHSIYDSFLGIPTFTVCTGLKAVNYARNDRNFFLQRTFYRLNFLGHCFRSLLITFGWFHCRSVSLHLLGNTVLVILQQMVVATPIMRPTLAPCRVCVGRVRTCWGVCSAFQKSLFHSPCLDSVPCALCVLVFALPSQKL